MTYVELLRARRIIVILGSVLLAVIAACAYLRVFAHIDRLIAAAAQQGAGRDVVHDPLGFAVLFASIAASSVATGLAAEAKTVAIVWTRPLSRTAIAWRYVAVDLATIVAVYALAAAAIGVCFTLLGAWPHVRIDGVGPATVAVGPCASFMWYAEIVVVIARFPGAATRLAGLSWVAYILALTLLIAPLPAQLHSAVAALNLLNPLDYYGGQSNDGISIGVISNVGAQYRFVSEASDGIRALVAAAIAAAALAAGVRLWATREA